MLTIKLVILLSAIAVTRALPLAKVHVKFVSPPHIYEHGITTDGRRVNHRNRGAVAFIRPENAESLWPVGVFLPPIDVNDLGFSRQDVSRHMTPDFSNGLEYHDPLLLTGEKALMIVKYLYGHGELFYDEIPHERALLRNQEERRENGLHDHVLGSLRPTSTFFRKGGRN